MLHDMVDVLQGWRCIGCGKVDAPQPCIGVCQDRPFRFVAADAHEALERRVAALEAVLALIAHTTPHPDKLPASWLALQRQARAVLAR